MTTYTTRGSVRGSCGHNHRTIATACRCLKADQAGCRSQRGYSDRTIHAVDSDGTECDSTELTLAEHDEWEFYATR